MIGEEVAELLGAPVAGVTALGTGSGGAGTYRVSLLAGGNVFVKATGGQDPGFLESEGCEKISTLLPRQRGDLRFDLGRDGDGDRSLLLGLPGDGFRELVALRGGGLLDIADIEHGFRGQ